MIIRIGIILSLMLQSVAAFFLIPMQGRSTSGGRMSFRLLFSSDQSADDKKDWQGFNPFDPSSAKASFSTNTAKSSSTTTTRISLRKTQMQELMSQLLQAAEHDQAMMTQLLESSKELLLEPLEDEDAVLETDSIYRVGMTRTQRYQRYRQTMDERIQSARNPNVRKVLQTLSDFVLSYE